MEDFEYLAPLTLADAFAAAAEAPEASRMLAGGTDLFLALEHGERPTRRVIDLKRIPGLNRIEDTAEGGLRLGALVPMAELAAPGILPAAYGALAAGAAVVGGPAIRNRATLGGNLCSASPAADTGPPLLALGARVEVAGPGATRTLPLADWWRAPGESALAPGEILTAVLLPAPPARSGSAFERLTRAAMDIALVNAAARVELDGGGRIASLAVALGAVAPVVLAVPGTETLHGRVWDGDAARELAALAQAAASPIDDLRASADYRREMAGVMASRAAERACAAAGKGEAS